MSIVSRTVAIGILVALSLAPAKATAQLVATGVTNAPAPEMPTVESPSAVDANGVNVATGSYQISSTDVSIGPVGSGGLALVRGPFDQTGRITHNHMGSISRLNGPLRAQNLGTDDTPHRYSVSAMGYAETFTCAGSYPVYYAHQYTACTSDDGRGGTLDFDPDDNPNTSHAIYRAADGSFGVFDKRGGPGFAYDYELMDWTDIASSVVTHYEYKTVSYCTWQADPVLIEGQMSTALVEHCELPLYARRLQSVTNTLGYQLKFEYATNTFFSWNPNSPPYWDPNFPPEVLFIGCCSTSPNHNELRWRTITAVTAINNAVEYCSPTADSCTLSGIWPKATYATTYPSGAAPGYPMSVAVTTAAQDSGVARTTTYYLPETYAVAFYMNQPNARVVPPSSITLPGSSEPDILIEANDIHARVTKITYRGDGTERSWTYSYSDASNPYIWAGPYIQNLFNNDPTPQPAAPPAGYSGYVARTTTVSDPLNNQTVYTSSVGFRSRCDQNSYSETDFPYRNYYYYFCNTQILDAHVLSVRDPLNRTTTYQYDSYHRVTRATPPEGTATSGYTQYSYDTRGNVTEVRRVSKTPGTPADIVTTAIYPAAGTCASDPIRCNKPTSITNARGFTTDFTYDATHGGVLTATLPAPSGGAVRPQTRYTYGGFNARYYVAPGNTSPSPTIWRLVETSACATLASCDGTADETVTTTAWPASGSPNNQLPVSTTTAEGDGSPSATLSFTYDDIGDQLTVDGPLAGSADTARSYYNAHRELIGAVGPDPDGGGALLYRATRTTIDAKGLPTVVEQGTTTSQAAAYATAFASFVTLAKTETVYNGFEQPSEQRIWDGAGGTLLALTETSYDAALRPLCSAVRMNPAQFGYLVNDNPANDACMLSTEGAFGPDRITRTVYDAAGQVLKIQSAYGTPLQQDTRTAAYTSNGLEDWVQDANGNRTNYSYDGFDRLVRIEYPVASVGAQAANAADYELFTLDAAGNRTAERRRSGETFNLAYDNLSRLVRRDAPSGQPDETRSYDNLGRQTCTQSWTTAPSYPFAPIACLTGSPLQTVSATFDGLSRQRSETSFAGVINYEYDPASRRTRMTWPDGYYVDYVYNTGNDLTEIRENGATSGAGLLAVYAHDDLGRRTFLTRGNTATTDWNFDAAGRLSGLIHNLSGSSHDQTFGFSYTPASQLAWRSRTNGVYDWAEPGGFQSAYTVNGLNQYLAVAGVAVTHDPRGNMTADWEKTYGFDFDNRLTSASGGVTLVYDPTSRLHDVTGGSTTRFLYDGADVIAELNASGTVLRRYVHGPGVDDPLVWLEGSSTSDRRWLIADERGSVLAVTNGSGALVGALNRYDAYGTPADGTVTGRFGYTGQMWIPELALYHYKARVYHPRFGRFLQTDPIRYGDGMHLYAYVGNDPVSAADPSGTCEVDSSGIIKNCAVNFQSGVSDTEKQSYLEVMADWGSRVQTAGTEEMRTAWAQVDSITIGPGAAVDPATGDPLEGLAQFGVASVTKGDFSGVDGELTFSSDQFQDASGNLDTAHFAETFFHEVGHGTPDSMKAGYQGNATTQENEAEYHGLSEAQMFNIGPLQVRDYSTYTFTTTQALGSSLGH